MQLFLFILVSVSGRSGRRSVQRRTCHALLSVDDLKTAYNLLSDYSPCSRLQVLILEGQVLFVPYAFSWFYVPAT